jgi:hypothetical protein
MLTVQKLRAVRASAIAEYFADVEVQKNTGDYYAGKDGATGWTCAAGQPAVPQACSACCKSNVLLHDHRRAPGPAGRRPEAVGKDVAKSAFLQSGRGPFVSQSGGVTVPPRR